MNNKRLAALAAGLFLLGISEMANALSITTGAGQLNSGCGAANDTASAITGTITSAVDCYGITTATSTAVDYGYLSAETPSSTSILDVFDKKANASWEDTIYNNSPNSMSYEFNFLVNGALTIAGLSEHISENHAAFDIEIFVNDSSIWNSSAHLDGDYSFGINPTTGEPIFYHTSDVSLSGTDLGGYLSKNSDILADVNSASYSFAPYSELLSIGTLLPGELLSLKYIINVHSFGCEAGGGEAMLFMSGDLSSHPDPLPEPATILLFGTGIPALAWARYRRRKTRQSP